ncbi:hypothetical protein DLAC_09073 [Tieghemostelium lacteum]|uniref:Uncharacterized protein n=1 Tax=Tieghemostelium lacteum TaxID=361077 RepID=A0A151Z920_TIELA|nr:hypothetical protein DLAC_09073 [Tieghemostelium lacteum]|eukprot:KYQ90450.1 hypothetical protein DLAC_09073 [Tieghemostelium lacteum]
MNYKNILIFLSVLISVVLSQPSDLYLYTTTPQGYWKITRINISTGTITNSTTSLIANNYIFTQFLEVNSDGDLVFLGLSEGKTAYCTYSITAVGNYVNTSQSTKVLKTGSFSMFDSSIVYDNARNSVYFAADLLTREIIFVYDFETPSSYMVKLSVPVNMSPTGAFDGQDTYYLLESLNDEISNFTLYSYNFETKTESKPLNLINFPKNSTTFLFYANDHLYAATYNNSAPDQLALVYIDVTTGDCITTYTFYETGMPYSINYWTYSNYFVLMTQTDGKYFLTTLNLNDNTYTTTQIYGNFPQYPILSALIY